MAITEIITIFANVCRKYLLNLFNLNPTQIKIMKTQKQYFKPSVRIQRMQTETVMASSDPSISVSSEKHVDGNDFVPQAKHGIWDE